MVTFDAVVAHALLRADVAVLDSSDCRVFAVGGRVGDFGAYHLPEGATLTSEQVRAAVGADPERLAAERTTANLGTYAWIEGRWSFWSPGYPYVAACGGPDHWAGDAWRLVLRPDLEQPLRHSQGTTLRAIRDWCISRDIGGQCRRVGDWVRHISFERGQDGAFTAHGGASLYSVFEAEDWKLTIDGGKTWFVPEWVEPREGLELWVWMCRTGRHVTSGLYTYRVSPFGRVEILVDGYWTMHSLPLVRCTPADGLGWDDEA